MASIDAEGELGVDEGSKGTCRAPSCALSPSSWTIVHLSTPSVRSGLPG